MRLPRWLGHPRTHAAALLLSLLAALAVTAFMVGTLEYTKTRGRLLLTALMTAGYFLTMIVAAGTPKEGVAGRLYAATFGFATLALLLLLAELWVTPGSDGFWRAAAGVAFLALGMSFAGLALGLGAGGRGARALAWASVLMAAGLTAMTVLGIAAGIGMAAYWWGFGILAVCWLATSMALAATRLWRRRSVDG